MRSTLDCSPQSGRTRNPAFEAGIPGLETISAWSHLHKWGGASAISLLLKSRQDSPEVPVSSPLPGRGQCFATLTVCSQELLTSPSLSTTRLSCASTFILNFYRGRSRSSLDYSRMGRTTLTGGSHKNGNPGDFPESATGTSDQNQEKIKSSSEFHPLGVDLRSRFQLSKRT